MLCESTIFTVFTVVAVFAVSAVRAVAAAVRTWHMTHAPPSAAAAGLTQSWAARREAARPHVMWLPASCVCAWRWRWLRAAGGGSWDQDQESKSLGGCRTWLAAGRGRRARARPRRAKARAKERHAQQREEKGRSGACSTTRATRSLSGTHNTQHTTGQCTTVAPVCSALLLSALSCTALRTVAL